MMLRAFAGLALMCITGNAIADAELRTQATQLFGRIESPKAVLTSEAELGRALFWDKRVSADGKTACASCHEARDWGADRRRFSTDARGALTSRHSPTIFNSMGLPGLRWLSDLRLYLPVSADVEQRFVAEARGWPSRAVYCPLWLLAELGAEGIGGLPDRLEAGPAERRLLRRLLIPLLLSEPWLGLPAWRGAEALHAWLFSQRSLFTLLPATWGEGILRTVLP